MKLNKFKRIQVNSINFDICCANGFEKSLIVLKIFLDFVQVVVPKIH